MASGKYLSIARRGDLRDLRRFRSRGREEDLSDFALVCQKMERRNSVGFGWRSTRGVVESTFVTPDILTSAARLHPRGCRRKLGD